MIFYLSFVDTDIAATIPYEEMVPGGPSFLGVIVAMGRTIEEAMESIRCINPGGEAAVYPLDADRIGEQWFREWGNRVLTFDDIARMPDPAGDFDRARSREILGVLTKEEAERIMPVALVCADCNRGLCEVHR